jgi:hypothetical protein
MAEDQNKYTQDDVKVSREFVDAVQEAERLFSSIGNELGKQRSEVQIAAQQYRSIGNNLRKLYDETAGISNLTSDQLSKLKDQNDLYLKTVEAAADRLMKEKQFNAVEGKRLAISEEELRLELENEQISQKQYNLLLAKIQGYQAERGELDDINKQIQVRLQYEQRVNDLTSLTSATLKSTQGILKSLGASSLGNVLNLQGAKEAMDSTADSIARARTLTGDSVTAADRLEVSLVGVRKVSEGITKALFSAEAIIAGMALGSGNINNIQKQLGTSYSNALLLNMELSRSGFFLDNNFVNSERLRKSFSQLTKEIGMSAEILGTDNLVAMSEFTELLGMSTESAAALVQLTASTGGNAREAAIIGVQQLDTFNKQNKTLYTTEAIFGELSNISLAVATNLDKNPKRLVEAAASAKKLGLNLEAINKIANSMLDFESSIDAELQAQLLSGKSLNLSRARELAMMGEQDKLAEELGNQEAIREAFATKNVIIQRSIANSIGISVEELAKINQQQELNNLSAEQFIAKYDEVTYQSAIARSATDKLGDSFNKIKSALIDIASLFAPILDGIAYVAGTDIGKYIIAGGVALAGMTKIIPGIVSGFTKLRSIILGTTIAQETLNKATTASTALAKSPTSAFSTINTTALLKGAAAMAVAAGGIFIFGKAIQELEKVEDYEKIAKGLGAFVVTMGLSTAIMSAFAPVAYPAAAAMIAFGGAVALMGAGVNLASRGFAIVTDSLSTLSSINLISVGAGLASVGTGMMAMMSGSLLGGLGAMAVLGTIATLASPLTKSASAVQLLANSFGKLGENIDNLDTDKLNQIKEIVISDTTAAPIAAAAANIGELIGTISGGGDSSNNKELISRMDTLIAAVQAGGTVYIDSKAAGEASVLNNFKS